MNKKDIRLNEAIPILYGNDKDLIEQQTDRYNKLVDQFNFHFESDKLYFFSTPGRTEICSKTIWSKCS